MAEVYFSTSYRRARERFRIAADAIGASCDAFQVSGAGEGGLTIDVATLGPADAPAVVVSSGVHGVEGFFGSAVQLAMLDRLRRQPPDRGLRFVLIHAINPFGFDQLRRFDEANIDLNRNFLIDPQTYKGSPAGYAALDKFLNPASPAARWELPFHLQAMALIARHGMATLKSAVAGGQYEYPRGLFFGGSNPSASMIVVRDHCESWIGDAPSVVHIDLHSGLGRFGECRLMPVVSDAAPVAAFIDAFPDRSLEFEATHQRTAYPVRGGMGQWFVDRFGDRPYRFALAEFGTYGPLRVLAALRRENRFHFQGPRDTEAQRRAKAELLECFCPRSAAWRRRVIDTSLSIVDQASRWSARL
ncbi:M14 family metallopeptidase [Rosistilla oblonga]|uniref:M14 family metallopeptidase n=1 Tax=Rosistilla oblonga TaxID=2527990 RepID=UPI003A96F071